MGSAAGASREYSRLGTNGAPSKNSFHVNQALARCRLADERDAELERGEVAAHGPRPGQKTFLMGDIFSLPYPWRPGGSAVREVPGRERKIALLKFIPLRPRAEPAEATSKVRSTTQANRALRASGARLPC